MTDIFVVKNLNKGYVASNPWRYTQVATEADKFTTMEKAATFVRLNLPKMFQNDQFCVLERTSNRIMLGALFYDAQAVLNSSIRNASQVKRIKGKSRMYYKVEQQFEDKKSSLKALIDSLDDIDKLSKDLSDIDKKFEDMKHYIEFSCLNAADGYKAFKQMQDILLKRREIKDRIDYARMLKDKNINKKVLESALTYLDNLGNRSYEVRVDTGLFSDLTSITPN